MPTSLPARSILDGSSTPTTSTMKGALGALRDYLAEKIGADAGGPVVSSLNGGQLAGCRNKIINPFTENQRGLTSVADGAYCSDRWYVLTESGNVTYTMVADPEPGAPSAIRLTQPDATPKRMGAATIIESKEIRQYRSAAMNFAGRVKPSFTGNVRYAIIEHTGTADVVTRDVVNNWASATFAPGNFFVAGINVLKTGTVAPGAATYGDFSDWVALGAGTSNVILFFWTEAAQAQNATLEANRPQYEPGIVRTPQEWRLNELRLCQRYYQAITGINVAGYAVGGAAVVGTVSFKSTMRRVPDISGISSPNLSNFAGFQTYGITADNFGFGVVASTTGMTFALSAVANADAEIY